jgi:hypothetical protein
MLTDPFVIIVIAALACFLLLALITEVRKYGTRRYELDIKRDMVERGMSAEEIERVIAAKSPGDK